MVQCAKCNVGGHTAKQCRGLNNPPDRYNPRDADRLCMTCMQVGHKEANCLLNNLGDLNAYVHGSLVRYPGARGPFFKNTDGRLCFVCKERGHIGHGCPIARAMGIESNSCYICGKVGHFKKSCPNKTNENVVAPWRSRFEELMKAQGYRREDRSWRYWIKVDARGPRNRNHPGQTTRIDLYSQEFRSQLEVFRKEWMKNR